MYVLSVINIHLHLDMIDRTQTFDQNNSSKLLADSEAYNCLLRQVESMNSM